MTQDVATSTAVTDLIAAVADNKLFLGRRYAEWCTGAPTLEAAVAAASMAQDEIGHARSFYPLLQDLAGASEETQPESRTRFTNVALLNEPFESWTDFVAANLLLDTALSVLLEAAGRSSFAPLAQRAQRILEEEPLHWLHGEGWIRRLVATGPGVTRALTVSLANALPYALQIFGCAVDELVDLGILDASEPVLLVRFERRVQPVLQSSGLDSLMTVDRSSEISCPFCSSTDTELTSLFGQQLLTVQYYCRNCHTPFERIKDDDVLRDAERSVQREQSEG